MPNIVEQRVNADGIYIKASDGREITLTKRQIRNLVRKDLPDKARGAQKVMQAIENALGAEQVPVTRRVTPNKPNPDFGQPDEPERIPDHANAFDQSAMEFDFDESDGTPLSLEMS